MIRLLFFLSAFTVTPLASPVPTPRVAAPLAHSSPAGRLPTGGAIERSCANPKLPLAIVTGRPGVQHGALPVLSVQAPGAVLRLAVARTLSDAELGLMCIRRLAPHAGMVFVFPADDERQFWMKNTLVSLDMLFVADDGQVRAIAENVPATTRETPSYLIPRRAGRGRYVIELAAGEARRARIRTGTGLRLPQLSSTAR